MCGIVYYHNNEGKNVLKATLKHYQAQKERGMDGFGFVGFNLDEKKVKNHFRCETEKEVYKVSGEMKVAGEINNGVLFHHRMPTSTPNVAECAHPFLIENPELEDRYYFVHNGVISNAKELKEDHEKLGYKYSTEMTRYEYWEVGEKAYKLELEPKFNDSEALGIEVIRFIEGKSDKVNAEGSIAFICLRCDKNDNVKCLYYGRNYRNPLHLEQKDGEMCLKSVGAFADTVEAHVLHCYHYATGETTEIECEFDKTYSYPSRWQPTKKEETEDKLSRLAEDGVPLITSQDYFDLGSLVANKSVDDLLKEYDLDKLQTMLMQEFYLVEDLINYETEPEMIKRLESKKDELDFKLEQVEYYQGGFDPEDADEPTIRADEQRSLGFTLPPNE